MTAIQLQDEALVLQYNEMNTYWLVGRVVG
jgi:hypothetical protein